MPIRYRFDERLLRFEVKGEYDWHEAREVLEEAMWTRSFVPGETVLVVDSAGSEYQPSYRELLEIARYMRTLADRLAATAVVATDPLHLTLARMLAAVGAYRDVRIEVFEDPAAAEAWAAEELGRSPPIQER